MVKVMNRMFRIIIPLACFALLSQFAAQAADLDLSAAGGYAGPYTGIANVGAISGATTINASDGITGGTLGIGGLATLNSASITNNALIGGTLSVNDNVIFGDAITDSTTVNGTLDVTGATTLTGALTANGGETIINGSAIYSGDSVGTGNRMIVNGTSASIGNATSGLSITGATNVVSLISDNDASAANARASLSMSPTSASLLVNTNGGVSHGLDINQSSTVISGGTNNSTALILNDGGAAFQNTATGDPTRVTGVANGSAAFDAVNVRQLNALDKKMDSGLASVAALAAIPCPVTGKNTAIGVGFGNYGGESALAVGIKANIPKSNISVGAGVGFSSNNTATNLGVSFSF